MKHILLVDDEAAVRSAFALALEDTPCHLTVAENGREGLARFKEGAFDVVITDLRMPEMNGIELLDEIRKIDTQVPLRVITGFAQEFFSELKQAVQEGRDFELIRKPLERDDIRAIVASVLGIELDEFGTPESASPSNRHYLLRLYIIGETPTSHRALQNIEKICHEELADTYTLEVIDIFKNPNLAAEDRIIATPTLLKVLPAPVQQLIGDLANTEKVLLGLDLQKKAAAMAEG